MYCGKIGIGLTTWKRPEMYREARESVENYLGDVADVLVELQDGGACYLAQPAGRWHQIDQVFNQGWAAAKNTCLDYLYKQGCSHLFMIEDDTLVTDREAVCGYVDAALASGLHYLTAHPWGEVTTAKVDEDWPITFWAYVGSWWTYMSAYGYRLGGGYNDTLGGIMGDIELPQRWQRLGLTSGWGRLPDATGSENWVTPRCLTLDQSTIANQPGWLERQEWLLQWWAETMPETLPCEMRPAREKRPGRLCVPAPKPAPDFI